MYNRAVLARWRDYGIMPSLEERVAYLEGRFGEHTQATDGLRDDLSDLSGEMSRFFGQVDKRFEQIDRRFDHVDKRFEQVDRRFEQIDGRIDSMDRKFEAKFDRVDERFIAMDSKIDRHFTWLAGLQMATLLAVVGAVLGAYFK